MHFGFDGRSRSPRVTEGACDEAHAKRDRIRYRDSHGGAEHEPCEVAEGHGCARATKEKNATHPATLPGAMQGGYAACSVCASMRRADGAMSVPGARPRLRGPPGERERLVIRVRDDGARSGSASWEWKILRRIVHGKRKAPARPTPRTVGSLERNISNLE